MGTGKWAGLWQAFLQDARARRLRPTTIAEYEYSLKRFFEFVGDREPDRAAVRDWTVALQEEGLADRTITKHLRGLKVFMRFCSAEDTTIPPLKIPMPIVREEEEKHALTQAQIEQVDESLNDWYPLTGRGRTAKNLQMHLRFWLAL